MPHEKESRKSQPVSKVSKNWKILQDEIKEISKNSLTKNVEELNSRRMKQQTLKKKTSKSRKMRSSPTNDLTSNVSSSSSLHKSKLAQTKATRKRKYSTSNDSFSKSYLQDCKQRKTDSAKSAKKLASEIWFDNVDINDTIEAENDRKFDSSLNKHKTSVNSKLVKENAYSGLTKAIAMDCEMVGVGEKGKDSILARVSLVNQFGKCVYDKFVKPREAVTDYRTWVSGVRKEDLKNAEEFDVVQKEVSGLLKGRLLVGHALWNDMKVLFLNHPKKYTRDTARYKPFRTMTAGHSPALRVLCSKILGVQVQKGEHSSVQDAQAAMRLYTMHKREWEGAKMSKKQKKKLNSDKIIAAARSGQG